MDDQRELINRIRDAILCDIIDWKAEHIPEITKYIDELEERIIYTISDIESEYMEY